MFIGLGLNIFNKRGAGGNILGLENGVQMASVCEFMYINETSPEDSLVKPYLLSMKSKSQHCEGHDCSSVASRFLMCLYASRILPNSIANAKYAQSNP